MNVYDWIAIHNGFCNMVMPCICTNKSCRFPSSLYIPIKQGWHNHLQQTFFASNGNVILFSADLILMQYFKLNVMFRLYKCRFWGGPIIPIYCADMIALILTRRSAYHWPKREACLLCLKIFPQAKMNREIWESNAKWSRWHVIVK